MAYTFNDGENKITKLLPAYIFNYSYDNGKGLFRFIKYLTNYIETANEALDKICSELNVNSSNTYILDILAKKLGVEIPTTITSVEDKQTVLKGKIMTISSTGCAQALIDTIYGLYPDWHNYDSFGTPIEVGNTIYKLFCNTTETPNISELGWDNADETTTTTDTDGFETVTKILNVLVSTTGPVVQLVQKTSNGLEGYSVIVHYTTEEDDVNVISYKDKNTCDIEDLVDSNNMVTAISPEIDEVREFLPTQIGVTVSKYNTYNYPNAKDMYYNSYRTIEYTTNWENYTWQNLPNDISKGDIWQDNDGNIYATRESLQCKLNKQTLTWEAIQFTGLTSFYRQGIWTDGKKIYYSYEGENNNQLNYELTDNYTWIPKTWYGLDTLLSDGGYFRGGDVWSDDEKIYCSTQFILSGGTTKYYNYVLNPDTSTWSSQTWEGITNIQTTKLFYYKEQFLYCDSTAYYTLNIGTNKWTRHIWRPNGIDISAKYIWSNGSDYYYLSPYGERYKLNQTSFTWEPITWTGLDDISNPTGQLIWHFDNNVFYGFTKRLVTVNSDKVIVDRKRLNNNYQKVFSTQSKSYGDFIPKTFFADDNIRQEPLPSNTIKGIDVWRNIKNNRLYYNDPTNSRYYYKQTSAWLDKTWDTPDNVKLLYGRDIYTIDNTMYYTYSENDTTTPVNLQLVTGSTWITKSWGTSDIKKGRNVWKTADNTYYGSLYKFTDQYDFNIKLPTTITWSNIPDNFDPINIWHIGDTTYYSNGTIHKIINEDTTSFDNFTEWKGLSNFDGKDIWQDIDGNIFYKDTYILDTKTKTWLPKYWNLIDNKKSSDIIKSEYIWSDSTSTYINNDYILNSYIDTCTQNCKFDNKQLSIESKLKREYTTYPVNTVCLQAPSYALDMIKLPNNLFGWHSPDGIESPVIEVTIINNVTDKVQASFEIIREKYQNEWGRYIDKDDDFNPIINNAVSVIDTSSLLDDAKNMHYEVIIGGVDKDGNPGPKLTDSQKSIITEYLIPKFLGVSYEVKFK